MYIPVLVGVIRGGIRRRRSVRRFPLRCSRCYVEGLSEHKPQQGNLLKRRLGPAEAFIGPIVQCHGLHYSLSSKVCRCYIVIITHLSKPHSKLHWLTPHTLLNLIQIILCELAIHTHRLNSLPYLLGP
jgi:hypothetical protein